MYYPQSYLGSFDVGTITLTAGTTAKAIGIIPPFMGGPGRARRPWDFRLSRKDALESGITHIEKLVLTTGATVEQVTLMRPLNFSWFTVAIAKNGTAVTATGLFDDPGIFSTNYKYDGNLTQGTAVVADHGIAANDYIVYQLADGTWEQNTIASGTFGSSLTLTNGAGGNSATGTGGGIAAGAPCYYFGPLTAASGAFASQLKDPATGLVPVIFNIAASQSQASPYASSGPAGLFSTLHPGDPVLLAITELTNQAYIELTHGWYGKI